MPHLFKRLLLTFCIYAAVITVAHAQDNQLSFGVFPYVSPSKLIKHQAVMHQFLRKQLNQNIEFVTAQDLEGFAERTLNSEYDLIFAPPHLARYCEKNGLYTPLALTQTKIQGVYIVHKDSPIYTLDDLRGQKTSLSTVGFEYSLLYQIMIEQMKSLSINNIQYKEVTAHNNSIFSVYKKEVDVALTGVKLWKTLPSNIKIHLRKIGKTEMTPGFIIMARPSLARSVSHLFMEVEQDFNDSLVSGKYIFRGLKPYQHGMLTSMDPYIKPFEQH